MTNRGRFWLNDSVGVVNLVVHWYEFACGVVANQSTARLGGRITTIPSSLRFYQGGANFVVARLATYRLAYFQYRQVVKEETNYLGGRCVTVQDTP